MMAMPGTVQSVSFTTYRRNTIRLDGPIPFRLLPEWRHITAAGQEPAGEKTRSITHLILLADMARRSRSSTHGSCAPAEAERTIHRYQSSHASTASLAWQIVWKRSPCSRSTFGDPNSVSVTALSQQLPLRLIEA